MTVEPALRNYAEQQLAIHLLLQLTRYYLVAPVSTTLGLEGGYGRASDLGERLPAAIACWTHAPHPCP